MMLRPVAPLVALALALGGLVTSIIPADATTATSWDLEAQVALHHLAAPYDLHLSAFRGNGDTFLGIDLERRTAGGHVFQDHFWQVSGADLSCSPDLASCLLDSGTHLGSYGHIELGFAASAPRSVSRIDCESNGHLLSTETSRKGHLSGLFRLVTQTPYFMTLRNSGPQHQLPTLVNATISRTVATGIVCPVGGGSHDCSAYVHLEASEDSSELDVTKWLPTGPTLVSYRLDVDLGEPDVTLSHAVFGTIPNAAFRVTSKAGLPLAVATVDLGSLEPFLHGHATFTATGPVLPVPDPDCIVRQRTGGLAGPFHPSFDGAGAFPWHAPGEAALTREPTGQ